MIVAGIQGGGGTYLSVFTLQDQLETVKLGQPETATEAVLAPILSNKALFAVDLYEAGLADKVTDYLKRMLAGPGAVRKTLEELV